ncbi:MAG: beta-lactamase family protein [Gemmataceae bacterium]|nr:beta-lactamase family protein [Gemmataceae bacterium]
MRTKSIQLSTWLLYLLWLGSDPIRADAAPPVSGECPPGFEALDRIILQAMEESSASGAALAIAKDGRLVFARGYGHTGTSTGKRVEPTTLFRIASVSKVFTVAAICALVEQGKLKLEDPILDRLPVQAPASVDPRWRKIKVVHLVGHRGGFDREKSGDPMFQTVEIAREMKVVPPARPEHIVRYMLNQPLDFEPGTRFCYSNFGYCLLGRVIEKTSGKTYEQFVQESVLKPLGISRMRIGRTRTALPNEVRYYESEPATAPNVFTGYRGPQVPTPYGAWCLESMDAHGGWVASAVDLARFGAALDSAEQFPTVGGLTFKNAFFPEYYHFGAFSGSSALFRHGPNGVSYGLVFNSRRHRSDRDLCDAIHDEIQKALGQIRDWPNGDLFPKYLK